MPVTISLGRNQTISLNGATLEGVRDIQLTLESSTADVTSFQHQWRSTLPLVADATVRLQVYGVEDATTIIGYWNQQPPAPVTLNISSAGSAQFMVTNVEVAYPIAGVLAWDVTLKHWGYS